MVGIIIEVLIAIIAIIIIVIKFCKKNLKKTAFICILILALLIIAILFTVSLKDPKIEVKDKIQIEVKSITDLSKPKTTYMFRDVTDSIKVIGEVDYNTIGTYEIKYEVPMLFNTYTKTQIIEIVDTKPPEIKLEGGESVTCSYTKEYEELGFSAIDNYDGDVTEEVTIEKKQIIDSQLKVTYTVSDSSGNISTITREVNYVDDIPPTIALNGNSKVSVVIGNQYKELGAKATDNKDRRFNR